MEIGNLGRTGWHALENRTRSRAVSVHASAPVLGAIMSLYRSELDSAVTSSTVCESIFRQAGVSFSVVRGTCSTTSGLQCRDYARASTRLDGACTVSTHLAHHWDTRDFVSKAIIKSRLEFESTVRIKRAAPHTQNVCCERF